MECCSESIRSREAVMLATLRSGSLKRAQKGSEGESTGSGLSAVNDMSSEILYLLDPAQGVCWKAIFLTAIWQAVREDPASGAGLFGAAAPSSSPSSSTNQVVMLAHDCSSARATHDVIKATSETLSFLFVP